MSDEATEKSIITNLEAIFNGFGWVQEDLSSNTTAKTTPFYMLEYQTIDFEENFGQKPRYNELGIIIHILIEAKTATAARDKKSELTHSVRPNVTIDALNIGDLATSKLVSRVGHGPVDSPHSPPKLEVAYPLTVRYRET